MPEIREGFQTKLSVQECAATFRQAVQKSYSGSRKVISALGAMRGRPSGGIEFFEPPRGQADNDGRSPDWQGGAMVPGHSKAWGTTKMAVHIYVVDEGGPGTWSSSGRIAWARRDRPSGSSSPFGPASDVNSIVAVTVPPLVPIRGGGRRSRSWCRPYARLRPSTDRCGAALSRPGRALKPSSTCASSSLIALAGVAPGAALGLEQPVTLALVE